VSRKPTLKTIADLTGLAVPTVSRALGDAPDISATTKRKVRETAARIGYVPNRAGVRLRTGRTNVISLVLPTDHEMMDLTARLISSIASGLRGTSYHLTITPYFPGDDRLDPVRYIVETGSADAIILNQIAPQDARVDYLLDKRFPFATHGRGDRSGEHAYFDFDNAAFGRLGLARLAQAGRRRILLIAPPRGEAYARDMIAGARSGAVERGVLLRVAEGVSSDDSMDAIRTAVIDALHADPAIDGVLVGTPLAAMAAVAGLEAHGRILGRDVDLLSKDAIPFLRLFRAQIMVIEEDVREAGEFLARAARAAIADPGAPPMQMVAVPSDHDAGDGNAP
jgi:LacI family transcriptional regulator